MTGKKKTCFLLLITYHLSLITSFVIVFEAHNVVFAEIVAELHFDECERAVCAVAETMVGLGRNVDVLARLELKLTLAAGHVGDAGDDDPMLAAP